MVSEIPPPAVLLALKLVMVLAPFSVVPPAELVVRVAVLMIPLSLMAPATAVSETELVAPTLPISSAPAI